MKNNIEIVHLSGPSLSEEFFLSAAELVLRANFNSARAGAQFDKVVRQPRTQQALSAWVDSMIGSKEFHHDKKCFAVLIAKDAGKMIGIIQVNQADDAHYSNQVALVCGLAIHPNYWGQGIAKQLLTEAEKFIKSLEVQKAVLKVDEDNSRAISLYLNQGWSRPSLDTLVTNNGRQVVYVATLEKALT
jgi:ribosomal protein S18 acetylase RimI-like enzyme